MKIYHWLTSFLLYVIGVYYINSQHLFYQNIRVPRQQQFDVQVLYTPHCLFDISYIPWVPAETSITMSASLRSDLVEVTAETLVQMSAHSRFNFTCDEGRRAAIRFLMRAIHISRSFRYIMYINSFPLVFLIRDCVIEEKGPSFLQ